MRPVTEKLTRERAEIYAAFEPQFRGCWGTMRFDEHERLIDVENRKVTIRWVCRHDMSQAKSTGAGYDLQSK